MRKPNIMKKLILLLLFIPLVNCSDSEEILDNVPESNDDTNPVYLDTNGVSIKAKDWAVIGDSGIINGVTYTIVDRQTLFDMRNEGEDVSAVCTSLITNMENMLAGYEQWGDVTFLDFNQDISTWDVSNVTNMTRMFQLSNFNSDISDWDVSSVTTMFNMFNNNTAFNQEIADWDVSSVADFTRMFYSSQFNQDIGNWNVSSATFMDDMFGLTQFNNDIGDWEVSNVLYMGYMFESSEFNKDIGGWDVSNVTNMDYMFAFALEFNQDLSSWSVENVNDCDFFSLDTPSWTLPQPNFTNCDPD